MVNVHGAVPVQPVFAGQPPNVEPAPPLAVSVTALPNSKFCVQSAPQLMPVGADVIVPNPAPVPVLVIVIVKFSR